MKSSVPEASLYLTLTMNLLDFLGVFACQSSTSSPSALWMRIENLRLAAYFGALPQLLSETVDFSNTIG